MLRIGSAYFSSPEARKISATKPAILLHTQSPLDRLQSPLDRLQSPLDRLVRTMSSTFIHHVNASLILQGSIFASYSRVLILTRLLYSQA